MIDAFNTRWVAKPEHLELDESGLPKGFRAAACSAGIKPSGKSDLALIVCDSEGATSAVRQTRSSAAAAPVIVTRERCEADGVRAIVANSGNANAGTGEPGLATSLSVQAAAAKVIGLPESAVAICSTGVIGQPLDASSIVAALPGLAEQLHEGGEQEVAQAILTTDNGPKTISATVALSGGLVRLTAQAKGAGMINPSFATMFCFLQTDAKLSADTCDLLLGTTVKRSFERISVDGQLSTNDVVILIASGGSGVAVESQSADELAFGEALDSVMRELALQIVADGEGAARVGRIVVEGGDDQTVEHVARTVAGSPLVKAALHGGDPNWGRILGAVGMAIPDSPGLPVDIEIEGVTVCSMGAVVDHDLDALAKAVNGTEVDYLVRLPGSGSACEVFFSDLSHEYVTINSEYTT